MKKKIKYKDETINLKVVRDFLPPPEKLVLKEENVKVTLNLSKESISFFKKYAKKQHVHYQNMIKNILDFYVAQYK